MSTQQLVRILLSFRDQKSKSIAKAVLENGYPNILQLTEVDVFQEVASLLAKSATKFDVIVFEHNGQTAPLIKAFIELGKGSAVVMCSNETTTAEALKGIQNPPELCLISELETGLQKTFTKLSTLAKVPPMQVSNVEEYITMGEDALLAASPLLYDVFVRMGGVGRFVRLFKQGSVLERADLDKYSKNVPNFFFVRKEEAAKFMKAHAEKMEKLANPATVVDAATAKKEYAASTATIRDVLASGGSFSAEAQQVAKASVMMSLKALGSKPKLSSILTELKKKDGDYLAGHSMMIGQIACALAHKIGWNSPATYFKLSLAAFLHDISLNNENYAQVESIEAAKKTGKFTDAELNLIKLHASKSADYSKQFSEIPSDVDQIIVQHHERPDGTGFPRGLTSKQISPLSALFIMAHDLVKAVYEDDKTDPEKYFDKNAEKYQAGQFKKILVGFKTGSVAQ